MHLGYVLKPHFVVLGQITRVLMARIYKSLHATGPGRHFAPSTNFSLDFFFIRKIGKFSFVSKSSLFSDGA